MTDSDIAWISVRGALMSFFDDLPATIRDLVQTTVAVAAVGRDRVDLGPPVSAIDRWIGEDGRLSRLRLVIVCAVIDEVLLPDSDLERIATDVALAGTSVSALAGWQAGASMRRRHLAQARNRWARFRAGDLSPMTLHRLPAFPSF